MSYAVLGTTEHIKHEDTTSRSVVDQCSDYNHAFICAVSRGLMDVEHGRCVVSVLQRLRNVLAGPVNNFV